MFSRFVGSKRNSVRKPLNRLFCDKSKTMSWNWPSAGTSRMTDAPSVTLLEVVAQKSCTGSALPSARGVVFMRTMKRVNFLARSLPRDVVIAGSQCFVLMTSLPSTALQSEIPIIAFQPCVPSSKSQVRRGAPLRMRCGNWMSYGPRPTSVGP